MWRILIVLAALIAVPESALVADYYCLQYERVSLYGTLVRQVYAGPPEYESVTRGDEPQFIWVLSLERTICVVDANPTYPRHYNQLEVQVEVEPARRAQYRGLIGKTVTVRGKLRPGGAWDEKRLVLTADEIESTRPR